MFIYHGGRNGVTWYRFLQLAKYLNKIGHQVDLLPFGTDTMEMEQHREIVENYDVIAACSYSNQHNAIRAISQAHLKPFITDSDDNVLRINQDNPNFADWQDQPDMAEEMDMKKHGPDFMEKFREAGGQVVIRNNKPWIVLCGNRPKENVLAQMDSSAIVSVSTDELAKVYRPYTRRIEVVPNGVDFDFW